MNIQRFNTLYGTPETKALLRKALTSATNVGEALIPEHLEDVITNTAVRLVPELAVPVLRFDNQKFHEFDRLVTIPAAGSAMGESSTTPTRNSTYQRTFAQLKIFKRKGAVTGFLQDTSKNFIGDATVAEMESHIQSFGNDMRTYMIFGNSGADTYCFDGLDKFIATNRTNLATANQVQGDLSLLDTMIDANTRKQGKPHRKVFLISPELLSQLSRLWTNVRDVRNIPGTRDVVVPGGYRLESYRDVPFLETSATRPLATMGTVTLSAAGAGGAITDATYYIRVSAVTWDGEIIASARNNSITTSSNDTVTLSFTAIENALFYKVYCSTTLDAEVLTKVVSAFTYDGDGTPTAAITSIVLSADPDTAIAASVPTHMQSDIPLDTINGAPMEYLILWDLDEFQGLGKIAYTNEGGSELGGLITSKELAQTDDFYPFLLKSYAALIDAFEATSYLVRGCRTK